MNTNKRVIKSAQLKNSILLRLKCQPAIPIGTKSTTPAAKSPNWTAPNMIRGYDFLILNDTH
ncbi:hypothetical protein RND71_020388 [Anisodus tanguticus]|uniref:Uncharacterized protein n=1 Tax=Anisodus tanguticus TaxID=243964 RepID=A0AAE1VFB1_9SOLA|nr:hypothetical protein RND71_020388 [Anisodus tanguticus]